MKVEFTKYDCDNFKKVLIDSNSFEFEEDNSVNIPSSFLKYFPTKELIPGIRINVCEDIEDGIVYINSAYFSISKINDSCVLVVFEELNRRKFWDGNIGYKLYMETKKIIIEEREKEVKDIKFNQIDDDGDYISISYSSEIEAINLGTVIQIAEQLIKEIEGAVELTLGSSFKKINETKNEADFTIGVLIPLLRKLEFSDVRYNHGTREFGKDIIFSRRTEFDEFEY